MRLCCLQLKKTVAKAKTIRIAAGTPDAPYSGVWRVVADRSEIYIGASKMSMGLLKMSLHSSGAWIFAMTQQSGATFKNNNRRHKKWNMPTEHAKGVTRGPSVLIPHTSLGSRAMLPREGGNIIKWYPAPECGHTIEFSFYFVRDGINPSWEEDETMMGALKLSNGNIFYILASSRPSPKQFLDTNEKLLKDNIFRYHDISDFIGGCFLWITESPGETKIPMIVDLPAPVGLVSDSSISSP